MKVVNMMVEVFKTNVTDRDKARFLIDQIQARFNDYTASFDLEDCDRILVVKSLSGRVQSSGIINLLRNFGFHGEVLSVE